MTTGKVIFDQGRKVVEEAEKKSINFGARWGQFASRMVPKPRFRWVMSPDLQVESRHPASSSGDLLVP